MAFYIQYTEDGTINSTINSYGAAPEHPRQIVIEEGWIPTDGKRVNLTTLQLEDIPQE